MIRNLLRRALIGTMTVLLPLAVLSVPPPTTDIATCPSRSLSPLDSDEHDGTPVVFIHGIRADGSTWVNEGEPTEDFLPHQVDQLPGASAWIFDYSHAHPEWVTYDAIGPELGRSLSCLTAATGRDAVVVAHSMGGLASRVAVSQTHTDGGLVADRVAEVITIGTPHRGSLLLSGFQGLTGLEADGPPPGEDPEEVDRKTGVEYWLRTCTELRDHGMDDGPCGILSLLRTPQGISLMYDSPQIEDLPPWPEDLWVLPVAGETEIVPNTGLTRFSEPRGDLIVTADSALGYHAGPADPLIVECSFGEDFLAQITGRGSLLPCEHGALKWHPLVMEEVLSRVDTHRE